MSTLHESQTTFSEFPEALYAVDVTFQHSFRPSGSMQEGKIYYSGKDKLYGIKVEMSVMPNGLAIGCSDHYPGSVSDLEIIQRMQEWHKQRSRKKGSDNYLSDTGLYYDRYPNRWAVLADKGYQGLLEFLRAILPVKNHHAECSVFPMKLSIAKSHQIGSLSKIFSDDSGVCGHCFRLNGGGR